jgi:hypothetical protein
MGRPSEHCNISDPAQSLTVKVGYVVYLDLIQLNPGLDITSSHLTKIMVLYMRAKLKSLYKYRFSCRFLKIVW